MDPQKAFYTIKEFAHELNVSYRTILRSLKSGHINAFRVGSGKKSSLRIPASEIHRLAEKEMNKNG